MYTLGMILYSAICLVLILFVLVRPAEGGGGLGGAFGGGGGGGDGAFGVKAMQTLDKVIAWTSVLMLVLALVMAYAAKSAAS